MGSVKDEGMVGSERRYRREAFVGVDAFSGEYLVAIEDLKKTRHAPHLLVNVFLQVLVAYYSRRHFFFLLLGSVFWLGWV